MRGGDEVLAGLASDNTAPVAPAIMEALLRANREPVPSYGADPWTRRLQERFRELFETEVAVFPVSTGTIANVLAVSALTPPYGAILCHEASHLVTDESTAPELFTGGARLVALPGERAKLAAATVRARLAAWPIDDVHAAQPAALAITQATELGAIYTVEEVRELGAVCRDHGLSLFMDGARFANAVAELGCTPAELTWRAGVKILSFGATKNGAMNAEAIVVFDSALARGLAYRAKRAGQLASKMRYLSAQLLAYVEEDLWLANARHANAMAQLLARALDGVPGVEVCGPVQGNEVFVRMAPVVQERLQRRGWAFNPYPVFGPSGCRLVTAWSTEPAEIERFAADAGDAAA
ncbi:threonine aldolase family protein [Benzoatithermus flavus]|uniref:L-threonine aldolase n=1 Tax=Benzoatithermus flavus TaxID=3108223 RepID=A0ABU8XMZ7_9PROT